MMRAIPFFLSLILIFSAKAQSEPIKLNSDIEAVTVFLHGAQVTRTSKQQIPAGNHTLLFTGITKNMDPNSIQLNGTGNLTILSISFKRNFLSDEDKSENLLGLEAQLEELEDEIRALRAREDGLQKEKEMILTNQKLGGENAGFTLQELQQTTAFVRKRIEEINISLDDIRKQVKELAERKRKMQSQINEEKRAFSEKTSQVEVKLEAASTTSASFELTYLVNNAGWIASYDARVNDLESPLVLTQKAQIVQQTGEDWNNVKLKLSTGNPSLGGQVPYLDTWYVDFTERYVDGINVRGNRQKQSALRNADDMALESEASQQGVFREQEFEVSYNLTQEEYSIDKRQNISSNSNPETVQLREMELPAYYEFHIKPRLDKDAFLIAKIYDWDQYNLLDGELSLFNGNTFVGNAYLNTQNPDDTLQLSLGRDQNIIVQRNRVRSKEEKSFLGGKKIEQFTWKIEVRNTKNTTASIVLKEPLPVSRNEEIEVNVEELSGGQRNEETGIVKWEFELPAGEQKEFIVSYEVKYPKEKQVRF